MDEQLLQDLETSLRAAPELNEQHLMTYVRLFQLEIWLRYMVYTEFRAKYGDDWHNQIVSHGSSNAQAHDMELTHMPTPEAFKISFVSFGDLVKAISKEWELFKTYLPPQAIWDIKLKEVIQIRNRVAHFRRGHRDDLQRVVQLLRDIDNGVWSFCTSLNDSHSVTGSSDPVISEFAYLNPYVPTEDRKPTASSKFFNLMSAIEMEIQINRRPWQTTNPGTPIAGQDGFLYDVIIVGIDNRVIDYEAFLTHTKPIHSHLVYISLQSGRHMIETTIPSILGKEKVIRIIDTHLQALNYSLHRENPSFSGKFDDDVNQEQERVQRIADKWPEYVLGPKNPITFLGPDMPCSMFNV